MGPGNAQTFGILGICIGKPRICKSSEFQTEYLHSEPKCQWVMCMWIYFHSTRGENSTYFQGYSVVLHIWIHIRRNLKVGDTCIQTYIYWEGFQREPSVLVFPRKSGHTWTTSNYVNGFTLCPRGNFKLGSEESSCTFAGHLRLDDRNLQGGDRCIQINLCIKIIFNRKF